MKKYKWLGWLILLLGFCFGTRLCLLLQRPAEMFPLSLKWQADLGGSTYERPVYQDELVLFPTKDLFGSYWYGIEANTGQVVWSQQVRRNSFHRCLTTEYLVLSGPQSLFVLKPRTGDILWKGGMGQTATCGREQVFVTGLSRDSIEALNISTGQQLWRETSPRKTFYGVIYNAEANEIIAKETKGLEDYYIIDPKSGRLLHSFEKVAIPPVEGVRGPMYLVDQGQLFIGSTVLDARTGQIIHKEDRYNGLAAPTVVTDTIYLSDSTEGVGAAGVIALDRATFNIKWKYQPQRKFLGLPLPTLSPVAILNGVGYAVFADATLRAFDLETGQELGYWQPGVIDLLLWPVCTVPPFPGCVNSSGVGITTSEDTLFVSFGDGKLYAFGQ